MRNRRLIIRWIALLFWMGLIFYMSNQPGDVSSKQQLISQNILYCIS